MKLTIVVAFMATFFCVAPALANTTPVYVATASALTSQTVSAAGDVAFANGVAASGDAPQIQYTSRLTACPYSTVAPYQYAATGGYWCMTPVSPLDLRKGGVVQDYTGLMKQTQAFTFSSDGAGNTVVTSDNAGGHWFDNFPYGSAGDAPVAVTISGLAKGAASVPAPNGTYKAIWNANNSGHVWSIKLLGVPYGSPWATAAGVTNPTIAYPPGVGTNGGNTDNHDKIAAALAFACAAGIEVTDGPGGEATAEPIDINDCHNSNWHFSDLAVLPPPHGATIGWDEGLGWTKRVTYLTPGSWDGYSYQTPSSSSTDPNGNGYVANLPAASALWPASPLFKVFDSGVSNGAGHNLVGIAFQTPVIIAKGQLVRVHGSNVAGTYPGYLEGVWSVYDIASGFEGCTLPCATTGVILANSDTSKISQLPQFLFPSMIKNGTNIEVDLPYAPPYGGPTGGTNLWIANPNYDSSLLGTSGVPKNWSYTAVGNGGYKLTGSTFPSGMVSPSAVPAATVAVQLAHGVLNFGYSTATGYETNTNDVKVTGVIDCADMPGCVGITNYSDRDTGHPLVLQDLSVINWNHMAVLTYGEGARIKIDGGNYSQTSGGPGAYGLGIQNSIGTLGNRTGIAWNWGNTGDSLVTGGVIAAYNYMAWLTESDTLDIASHDSHTYNGVSAPQGGPYYPNIEGEFCGSGSHVFSMFDAGQILICATKGVPPYVQVSGEWDYASFGSMANSPLGILNDCFTLHCASLANVTGGAQGIDPNQLAQPNAIAIGGYQYGTLTLENLAGDTSSRVWSDAAKAVATFYNSAINSYDNPLTLQLNAAAFTFTGNLTKAQTSAATTAAVTSGNTVAVSSTANLMTGMAFSGAGVPALAQVGTVVDATHFTMVNGAGAALNVLPGGIPNGVTLAFPYVTTTISGAVAGGSSIVVASTAGIFQGFTVLGPPGTLANANLGPSAVQPGTTVLNIDAGSNTIYLSRPLAGGDASHNALANGQLLAFQGGVQSYGASLNVNTGYTISNTSLYPQGGTSIVDAAGNLPAGPTFHVASVQPFTNTINLLRSDNSNAPPAGSVQSADALTIGGVSGWTGDLTPGSWQITNVRYGGIALANLIRQGMVVTDSCGALNGKTWWIDSVNYQNNTVSLENANDDSLGSTCTNDTFTVTPYHYVLQAADSGQTIQLSKAATNFNLYLQPSMPTGWWTQLATQVGSVANPVPNISLQVLDGPATGLSTVPTLNGIADTSVGATVTIVANNPSGLFKVAAAYSSAIVATGTNSGLSVSNYVVPTGWTNGLYVNGRTSTQGLIPDAQFPNVALDLTQPLSGSPPATFAALGTQCLVNSGPCFLPGVDGVHASAGGYFTGLGASSVGVFDLYADNGSGGSWDLLRGTSSGLFTSAGNFMLTDMVGDTHAQAFVVDNVYDITTTSGSVVTMAQNQGALQIHAAGTLATLTVKLPPGPPVNGQQADVCTDVALTALTLKSGAAVVVPGAPAGMAAHSCLHAIYNTSNTQWTVH